MEIGIDKTPLLRTEIFNKETCIFFDELSTMMIALASFILTSEIVYNKKSALTEVRDENLLRKLILIPFPGLTIKELYAYEAYPPLKIINSNTEIKELIFHVHEPLKNEAISTEGFHFVNQPYFLNQRIIGAAFANFFESKRSQIEARFSSNTSQWPMELNFCRVIRNAFSHKGEIYFNNPSSSPVSWKALTYSPSDNGKSIYNEIYLVEIIDLFKIIERHII